MIGIDLGTTNSALAFIDQREADSDFPPINVLDIPQVVAPGVIESRRTLPSFLFLGDQTYVGAYAREQGAIVPTKSVHSAKSWLSNPEVDRTAKILPWDAQEAGRVLSPVEVSAKILEHIAKAYRDKTGDSLTDRELVLTVPASFDEEARQLTVEAARQAGLNKLTLLEEPAAAFYSWIANDLARSQKALFDGQMVLVCDVGGGTSDFTLIRVNRTGDRVDFTRTAVGRHLLLGGDNLDMTLAWLVESKLKKQLALRQRSGLRRQCAAAKERLLGDGNLKSVDITVLGAGSSLIGGSMKTEITREEVLELALEGFLPLSELGDRPQEDKKSLFRESGLPYESDPAITRHLAAFLGAAGAAPDAILFNGGFFIPDILRERVVDVLEKWYGKRPQVFENRDLDLAVAVGAAYYSYVRTTGSGLVVRGGLPRSYYIGVASEPEKIETLCLVPRGTEEGQTLELDHPSLQLVANKPVAFRLYSSLTREEDKLGDAVAFAPTELDSAFKLHAPLHAVIRFGKPGEKLVPVKLGGKLTEVGTLELWADSKVSEHRWRLEFELRKQAKAGTGVRTAAVVSEEALDRGVGLIDQTFRDFSLAPEELPARLEQALALGRASWPLSAIRKLADRMLDLAEGRKRSAAHEVRWLNLCGFCLRPGFGFPGDDYRIELARRVYSAGLVFDNQTQNEIDWWIFCGRLAGGFNRNQQVDVFQRISPMLLPKGAKKPQRVNNSLLREMWRAAASLELLPVHTKTQLGDGLAEKIRKTDMLQDALWCMSRIGARRLFYGPINQVVPAATATRWLEAVLKVSKSGADCALALARITGDATRDLAPQTLDLVRRALPELDLESGDTTDLRAMGKIFGEDLPAGLVLAGGTEGV